MPPARLSTAARKSYQQLARSDRRLFKRLDAALDRITEAPGIGKPLVGPLAGHRSHRVGSLRIIYRLEHQAEVVLVLDIAHRGSVYR